VRLEHILIKIILHLASNVKLEHTEKKLEFPFALNVFLERLPLLLGLRRVYSAPLVIFPIQQTPLYALLVRIKHTQILVLPFVFNANQEK
jgi:hypothetical protein